MIDSMFSMLIFTMLVTILLPASLMLQQLDNKSEQLLTFHRQLYLEIARHENFDAFLKHNQKYSVNRGEICDKTEENLCFQKK